MDELAGVPVNGITKVVVTRDRAVVSAIVGETNPALGRRAEHLALVGTLD